MITITFTAIGFEEQTIKTDYNDLLDTIKQIESEYSVETLTYTHN